MTSQASPSHDLPVRERDLAAALGSALGINVRAIRVTPLGESSRETPWRVDLETDQGSRAVLVRLGESCSPGEVLALRAMESHPLPSPTLLHWDPDGTDLGIPLFVSTFIEGDPLLEAMKANEPWADTLYVEAVCAVQSIKPEDLPTGVAAQLDGSDSALDVLEEAHAAFEKPNELAEAAYGQLKEIQPEFPANRFSNGDLWPDNLLVQGDRLVGIIDWQHAGFGDPIFEFLLPFFLVPGLRNRGTEEAYCARMGFDPGILHWYHGLEFFDSLRWVLKTGEPYMIHTAESLQADLARWLEETA
ncbi:phosphotransferase family protein [Candidatus Bipolaricaulota bacterium]